MRFVRSILLLSLIAVSGCTTPDSSTPDPSFNEGQNQPEETSVRLVERGIFAYQFDPCQELPIEQLKTVGIDYLIKDVGVFAGEKSCGYSPTDEKRFPQVFILSTSTVKRKRIEEQNLLLSGDYGVTLPGVFVHTVKPGDPSDCVAAVEYSWGHFAVTYYKIKNPRALLVGLLVESLSDRASLAYRG